MYAIYKAVPKYPKLTQIICAGKKIFTVKEVYKYSVQTKIKQSELFTSAIFLRLLIQEYHFFRTVFYLFISSLKEKVISQYNIDKLLNEIITASKQLSNPKPENNFWLPLSQNIFGNLMIRSST